MKILFVSRWFAEERRRNGGAPGFFGELVAAIVAEGVDLTILSQADNAGLVPEPRPVGGLDLHVFSRERRSLASSLFDKLLKPWSGYRKTATDAAIIRRFVQEHGPFDVIVAQCEEPDGLACAFAARIGGLPPLVTHVHAVRTEFREGKVRFTRKSSLGFVFRHSARVVANSDFAATLLQREYGVPERKIGRCRIHLTAPFLKLSAQATRAEPPGPRILFLGALNRNKGPDVFLRAAIHLAPDLPGWTFVLVGPETSEDHNFRAELQQLIADPLLAGRLEMPGRLEPSAVVDQIRRARVVVCPSWVETFSRTTAESLALGRPVIVTETTGAATWVRATGAGSVIKAGDDRALSEAMRTWTARVDIPDAPAQILADLTATNAAYDWIREVKSVVGPFTA